MTILQLPKFWALFLLGAGWVAVSRRPPGSQGKHKRSKSAVLGQFFFGSFAVPGSWATPEGHVGQGVWQICQQPPVRIQSVLAPVPYIILYFSVFLFVLTRARCLHHHFRATDDGDSKVGAELWRDSPFSHAAHGAEHWCQRPNVATCCSAVLSRAIFLQILLSQVPRCCF